MEWLALIGLLGLANLILPWVNLARINRLERKIWLLERRMSGIDVKPEAGSFRRDDGLSPAPQPRTAPPVIPSPPPMPMRSAEPPALQEPVSSVPGTRPGPLVAGKPNEGSAAPGNRRLVSAFEVNVGAKLPVWIGSVSLIFAAFFLVRHAVQIGFLTETVRVLLGGAFGVALIGASLALQRRPHVPNAMRIAQGLAGAGIVVLYVALFAATSYYTLLAPLAGFAGMVLVTALAVILSLRHGQPIAAFGLIGGLLTPALVNSPEPNAVMLFGYLFALFAGLIILFANREWWALSLAALVGLFGWSGAWFFSHFTPADCLVLILFAVGVTGIVLATTGRRVCAETAPPPAHGLNILALAGSLATILMLGVTVELNLFDWSLLWLVGLAALVLTLFAPRIYSAALWAIAGVSLAVFLLWAPGASLLESVLVIAGMGALYCVLPGLLMRRVPDPRQFAALQCAAALALYGAAYFTLELPAAFEESFGMFWGIMSLILAGLAALQAQDIRLNYPKGSADDRARETMLVAFYALTASAFLSLGIIIETPYEYMPHAFALQLLATALIYRQTGVAFLQNIMMALTLVLAALYYEQILLFATVLVHSIGKAPVRFRDIEGFVLDNPFIRLAVPATLAGAALYAARTRQALSEPFRKALSGLVIALWAAFIYYLLRIVWAEGGVPFAEPASFLERGFLTLLLGGFGAAFVMLADREALSHLKVWGLTFIHLAMARLIWFDLLILNPAFNGDQLVGAWPLVNGVTLVYGAGAALTLFALRRDIPSRENFVNFLYRVAGYAMFFLLVTLNVRQIFHGEILTGPLTGDAEMYGYSAAWLLAGIALLVHGVARDNLAARISALVFLTLAIGKVFLFDMAGLEGLYRVVSFFGLGVCLIGLSAFYSRFMTGASILSRHSANPNGDSQ